MDLRQVEYALAVVDHEGFTKAARAVHVAQPSLSQAVRRLEAELGAPLFFRVGRNVRLTPAGEAFVGPARRLLREVHNVTAAVAEHATLTVGSVDVVALPTLVADPLAKVIGRFRATYPGIGVRVLDPGTAANVLAMVADGRAEIGVTDEARTAHGVVDRPVGEQELLAVLPPGAGASGRPIRLAEFARHPLVLGPPGTSSRQVLERALAGQHLDLTVGVEVSQRDAVIPLVLAGAGATALPAPLAGEATRLGATVVSFTPRLARPVRVVHRAGELTPAAAALLDVMLAERPRRRRAHGGEGVAR